MTSLVGYRRASDAFRLDRVESAGRPVATTKGMAYRRGMPKARRMPAALMPSMGMVANE